MRADYGDLFYMEKALEAINLWRTDPLYKPFYHESGLINIDNTRLGRELIEKYKKLKTDITPAMLSFSSSRMVKEDFAGILTSRTWKRYS